MSFPQTPHSHWAFHALITSKWIFSEFIKILLKGVKIGAHHVGSFTSEWRILRNRPTPKKERNGAKVNGKLFPSVLPVRRRSWFGISRAWCWWWLSLRVSSCSWGGSSDAVDGEETGWRCRGEWVNLRDDAGVCIDGCWGGREGVGGDRSRGMWWLKTFVTVCAGTVGIRDAASWWTHRGRRSLGLLTTWSLISKRVFNVCKIFHGIIKIHIYLSRCRSMRGCVVIVCYLLFLFHGRWAFGRTSQSKV